MTNKSTNRSMITNTDNTQMITNNDNGVAKTPIKLSKRPYYYECGDGCCTEWGETWFVNGEEVCSGPCDDNRLQQLLAHLGFDARIVNENENVEEGCEL